VKILETDRLILRRLAVTDAEFILSLLNQPSFLRFIGDKGVRSLDDARNYILEGPIRSYERFGFGLYLTELKEIRHPHRGCAAGDPAASPDWDLWPRKARKPDRRRCWFCFPASVLEAGVCV